MKHWKILLFLLPLSTKPVDAVGSECEHGWEENGGKCYFFSQDTLTWEGAEEECKMRNGSHLASVTDQQTDDFIARQIERGEAIWIGAWQETRLFTKNGSWAWADGCSIWDHTSWVDGFDPDGVLEYGCAFLERSFGNITIWRAAKCADTRKQFRYVCSKSTCSIDNSIAKTIMDPITFKFVVGASVGVGLLLIIAVAVFIFKKMKKRQPKPEEGSTDQNPLYGQYYKVDGERVDERRVYVEDSNVYYSRRIKQ